MCMYILYPEHIDSFLLYFIFILKYLTVLLLDNCKLLKIRNHEDIFYLLYLHLQ